MSQARAHTSVTGSSCRTTLASPSVSRSRISSIRSSTRSRGTTLAPKDRSAAAASGTGVTGTTCPIRSRASSASRCTWGSRSALGSPRMPGGCSASQVRTDSGVPNATDTRPYRLSWPVRSRKVFDPM